jgi:hypothetical protein
VTAAGVALVLFGLVALVLLAGPAGWPLTAGVALAALFAHLASPGDHRR